MSNNNKIPELKDGKRKFTSPIPTVQVEDICFDEVYGTVYFIGTEEGYHFQDKFSVVKGDIQ